MVNSLSSNIPNTNITASPKINEEKSAKIKNESKETKPQEVTLDKIKSFTTSQKNIGIATMGLGALAASSIFIKNKTWRAASVIPAAIVATMVGVEMLSGATKAEAEIKSIQSEEPIAKSRLDTEG